MSKPSLVSDTADKKPNWLVVVDPARAKIYADYGTVGRVYPVFGAEFTNPPALGFVTDIADDPRQAPTRQFLREIAGFIDEAVEAGEIDRITIVAPRALNEELQATLSPAAGERLEPELPASAESRVTESRAHWRL